MGGRTLHSLIWRLVVIPHTFLLRLPITSTLISLLHLGTLQGHRVPRCSALHLPVHTCPSHCHSSLPAYLYIHTHTPHTPYLLHHITLLTLVLLLPLHYLVHIVVRRHWPVFSRHYHWCWPVPIHSWLRYLGIPPTVVTVWWWWYSTLLKHYDYLVVIHSTIVLICCYCYSLFWPVLLILTWPPYASTPRMAWLPPPHHLPRSYHTLPAEF